MKNTPPEQREPPPEPSPEVEEEDVLPSPIEASAEDLRTKGDHFGRNWRWRIYQIRHHQYGWVARSLLMQFPLPVPRRFIWTKALDVDGLKAYIDAVLRGNETEAARFVERGLVVDITPGEEPREEVYHVRADAFLDYLLLRGGIDLPAHGILRLYTRPGGRTMAHNFVTSDFLCALAPLLERGDPARALPRDDQWVPVPRLKTGVPSWIPVEQASTGMYANGDATASSEVDIEREVRRQVEDDWVEVVTHVQPTEGRPYFARRVLNKRGTVVYAATAWHPHGPWKVYQRDNAALMLLGLAL